MQASDIKNMIESGINAATVIVEGDDGVHFAATVVSAEFINKSRIQRQQMVYATLGNHLINGTIHALSLKTLTPEEWQQ